jgi:hypothetical protein
MKHLKSSAATTLALLAAITAASVVVFIAGCGGSGSSSSNTTQPPPSNLGPARIEAIVLVSTANLKNPTEFTPAQLLDPTNQAVKKDLLNPTVFGFQDTQNFQTNEDYVFQLAAYGTPSSGNPYGRVILPATFSSSDTIGQFGTLAANSGVFLAAGSATTTPLSVYATYGGQDYSGTYSIKPRQGRVIGSIIVQGARQAVPGIGLNFYDANGNLTDSITTAVDGTFRASMPIASVSMTLDPHTIPLSMYGLFEFVGQIYTAGDPGCRAILPTLTVGTQLLPTLLTIPTTVKPIPATTGCG